MQGIVQGTIDLVVVRSLNHHCEILTVGPVGLLAQLCLHPFIEFCSGQRIRYRHSYVVGARGANYGGGFLDVFPSFPRVSELQEVAGANALLMKVVPRFRNLLDACSLIHGVENFLRPRLHTHPYFGTTSASQSGYGIRRHEVDSTLHFERECCIEPLDVRREFGNPFGSESKSVIREPEMLSFKLALELSHLFRHAKRRAEGERTAIDRFRTPVAAVRTTPARDNVQREEPVGISPRGAVAANID